MDISCGKYFFSIKILSWDMPMSIYAKCHCGRIEISVAELPEYLGHCNCSICRRYEALWGYYPPEVVTINSNGFRTASYIWGRFP